MIFRSSGGTSKVTFDEVAMTKPWLGFHIKLW